MFCSNCGASLKNQELYCSQCGTKVEPNAIPPTAPTPLAQTTSLSSPYTALPEHEEPITSPVMEQYPVLQTWKTSVGFSILGAIIGFVTFNTLAMFVPLAIYQLFLTISNGNVTSTLEIILVVLSMITYLTPPILYALLVYPSYFTSKPLLRSNAMISFWNLFFGVLILWGGMGAIWNNNLTKKRKGSSNWVFSVLLVASFAWGMVSDNNSSYTYNSSTADRTAATSAEWKSYTSDEHGFTINFPGTPSEEYEELDIEGILTPYTAYYADNGDKAYMVGVASYPKDQIDVMLNPVNVFDGSIKGVAETGGFTIEDYNYLGEFLGNPSGDAIFSHTVDGQETTIRYLIFLKDNSAYSFMAVGVNGADFDKFVQSFHFN